MMTLAACAALAAGAARAQPTPCRGDPLAPANTPTLQLDATSRPDGSAAAYGSLQYHRAPGLGPRDIALTVDDGPNGRVTPQILRILARHCLKTTFFVVGVYAQARPDLVRQEAEAGHFIGVHTWSHPNNLRRLSPDEAHREITRGFDAVETILSAEGPAAQKQMAPFFRFPGLNDSASLRAWLGSRHVAVVGADFGADDWKGIGPAQIQRRALQMAAAVGGGILILHDTKPHTAETLSSLITAFERRGYRFVQLVPARDARDHTGSAAPLQ
jgi:peptidoglycan/xylan/chitin deacetylase (PgdA/CDA1 family)